MAENIQHLTPFYVFLFKKKVKIQLFEGDFNIYFFFFVYFLSLHQFVVLKQIAWRT